MNTGRSSRAILASSLLALVLLSQAPAQTLRYDNHREIRPPDYATLRLGPFYSSILLMLSAGYRYVWTYGSGTDFLIDNERGAILKDGSDFPMTASLTFRNYLIVTRRIDLDLSVQLIYRYYPLDTQEDSFGIYLPAEGIAGNLSMEFEPLRFMKVTAHESFVYSIDFIDTRGMEDVYGGAEYEHFRNVIGVDADILLAPRHNLSLSAAREDNIPVEDEWEAQHFAAHRGSVEYQYRIAPCAVVGARAGLDHIDYRSSERPDSLRHHYLVLSEIGFTPRSTVKPFVGYSIGRIERPLEGEDRQRWATAVYGVSLETRLSDSLAHSLTYRRGQRGGFEAPFETLDELRYRLAWTGTRAGAECNTGLVVVDPTTPLLPGYTDWTSGISVGIPLTDYMKLTASSRYTLRDNEALDVADEASAEDLEEEWQDAYRTWASRLGLNVRLSEEVSLNAYAEHIERWSDVEELAYQRDVVGVDVRYTHQF